MNGINVHFSVALTLYFYCRPYIFVCFHELLLLFPILKCYNWIGVHKLKLVKKTSLGLMLKNAFHMKIFNTDWNISQRRKRASSSNVTFLFLNVLRSLRGVLREHHRQGNGWNVIGDITETTHPVDVPEHDSTFSVQRWMMLDDNMMTDVYYSHSWVEKLLLTCPPYPSKAMPLHAMPLL